MKVDFDGKSIREMNAIIFFLKIHYFCFEIVIFLKNIANFVDDSNYCNLNTAIFNWIFRGHVIRLGTAFG